MFAEIACGSDNKIWNTYFKQKYRGFYHKLKIATLKENEKKTFKMIFN